MKTQIQSLKKVKQTFNNNNINISQEYKKTVLNFSVPI